MRALIDTSFLVASMLPRDTHHVRARAALMSMGIGHVTCEPVLSELFYFVAERLPYSDAPRVFQLARSGTFSIQALTVDDRSRMEEIAIQYADSELDYADLALMALSERLNIRRIYTFDHRDFSIFRPRHCDYLEILP